MSNTSSSVKLTVTILATTLIGGCLKTDADDGDRPTDRPAITAHQGKRQIISETPAVGEAARIAGRLQPPQDAGTQEEEPEFATGISIYACDYEPPRLTLPRGHLGRNCEMTAVATPYRDDGGDVYDVSVPLVWTGGAPWVSIEPFEGNHRNTLVYGRSAIDLFDLGIDTEPEATVQVCAKNDCTGVASGCETDVCREIQAYAVVNLEGGWCMNGATFDGECSERAFVQDGRHITIRDGHSYRIGYGGIMAATISWEESDVLYVGTIDPSRDLIYGQAYWEMSDDYAGDWQATRLPGQEH